MDGSLNLPVVLDDEDCRVAPAEWNETAACLAQQAGIRLTAAHWTHIRLLRRHYDAQGQMPDARYALAQLSGRLGAEARDALLTLFASGHLGTVCRIADLQRLRVCTRARQGVRHSGRNGAARSSG